MSKRRKRHYRYWNRCEYCGKIFLRRIPMEYRTTRLIYLSDVFNLRVCNDCYQYEPPNDEEDLI